MPEGPEIHREADRLERALAGRAVGRVWFAFPELSRFAARLRGREVRAVEARGKALLIHFSGGPGRSRAAGPWSIYSHNLLYGRWYVRPAGERPQTRRSLRLVLENREHAALLYSASEIEVLTPAQLEAHPYLCALGPDPLAPDVDARALSSRVAEARFARRSLGALLLDQGFVAGIGNYLRSEILFVAGLHPALRPGDLSREQRRRLAAALLAIPRRAYRSGGVTNDPRRVRALRRAGERRSRYRHHVFARAGRACWDCGATIERREAAGRRVYLCPECQPAPSA